MPRPRTAPLDQAKWDRLPDIRPEIDPAALPPAREAWRAVTKREYAALAVSEAARTIRPAEVHLVTRYFDLTDKEIALWKQYEAAITPKDARDVLVNAHQVHRMILSLGREIGVSPLARRNLGVQAAAHQRLGSRLDAFRRGEDGPSPLEHYGTLLAGA